ncbi:peroxynitrite isomerase THAP4 isoform X2 [Ixodes scapularis]|uniref:peroxynitrite isomerase THAP4 isoform X2 n=1 Tax=Ixodes scapularis TaxID=6945 RepID=UPI001AD72EB7|nr:peroxynitrite isomerase THAP4 isoform X2 [Ixodes scapularis]
MPRHCAAEDCSNSVWYSGRPVHTFPREPTLRKLWIRAARPSQPTWKPAKGACLCTEHFADEDYQRSPKLLESLGLPVKQLRLKPGVVPSLFTRKRKRERHSGAVEKRRRKESSGNAWSLLGKLKSLVGLQDWVQATVKQLYRCTESSGGALDDILPSPMRNGIPRLPLQPFHNCPGLCQSARLKHSDHHHKKSRSPEGVLP